MCELCQLKQATYGVAAVDHEQLTEGVVVVLQLAPHHVWVLLHDTCLVTMEHLISTIIKNTQRL